MDSDHAKLFVGGLSHGTNEDALNRHFSKYGDVVNTVIMRDRNTGNTRGFGFITFSEASSADKALHAPSHDILGRTVEVKKAVPRSANQHQQHVKGFRGPSGNYVSGGNNDNQLKTKKIFVGGLSPSINEEEFRNYFEKFGKITDVVVMYDSVTRRPRGFGFITFDSEEAVENVMQKNLYKLNDKFVEVKRAIPKEVVNGNGNGNSYGCKTNGGRGAGNGAYKGAYQSFGPGFGFYQNYGFPGAPFVSCYGSFAGCTYAYGNPYAMGMYGGNGVGYGSHLFASRNSWNGIGMFGGRYAPMPYMGTTYPAMNGNAGTGCVPIPCSGMVGSSKGKLSPSNEETHNVVGCEQNNANGVDSSQVDGNSSATETQ